jgi:hypothetical protein
MNPEAEQSNIRASGRKSIIHSWTEMRIGFERGPVDYLWLYYTAFYSSRPEGRIHNFYVDALTIWKEPSALDHEYLVATIKSTPIPSKQRQEIDGQRKQKDDQTAHQETNPTTQVQEYYLLFERTAGGLNRERRKEEFLPEKWTDVEKEDEQNSPQHSPDRHLEEKMFNGTSKRKRQGTATPRWKAKDASGLATAALDLASAASESSSADLLLAEDLFELIEGPCRQEADQIVARLKLRPPPSESSEDGTDWENTLLSERTVVPAAAGTQSMAESLGSPGGSLPRPDVPRTFSNQQGTFQTSRQDLTSLRQQPSSRDVTPRLLNSNDYQRKSVSDSSISNVTSLPYAFTSNISPQLDFPPDFPPTFHDETLSRPSGSGSGRGRPASPASSASDESSGHDSDSLDDSNSGEGSDEVEVVVEDDNDEQDEQDVDTHEQDEQSVDIHEQGQDANIQPDEQNTDIPEQDGQDPDIPMSPGPALSETLSLHSSHSFASNPSFHHPPLTRVATNATNATRSSRLTLPSFNINAHGLHLRRVGSNATRFFDSLPVPPSRQHIYLYELVVLACRLHKCKSLYRIFTRNCYWFAGMIFHVIRNFTGGDGHVVDEAGIEETLRPSQEVHRWINEGRMGTFLRSITVVKAPRMFTIDAVIRKWHGANVRFRDQASHA